MNSLSRRKFLNTAGKTVFCACAGRCLLLSDNALALPSKEEPDAYCGIYCAACPAYLESKQAKRHADIKCLGCKSAEKPPAYRTKCAVRKCAVSRNLASCGLCKEFPCAKFEGFFNDKPKYGLREKYLHEIRAKGHAKWLQEAKTRWTCPKCGAPFGYGMTACPKCGAKIFTDTEEFEAYKQTKTK